MEVEDRNRRIITDPNTENDRNNRQYWRYMMNRAVNIEYNGIIYQLTTDLCLFRVNEQNEILNYYGCYNPQDRINDENIGRVEFMHINLNFNQENHQIDDNRNIQMIENNRNQLIVASREQVPNMVLQHFRNTIVNNLVWQTI